MAKACFLKCVSMFIATVSSDTPSRGDTPISSRPLSSPAKHHGHSFECVRKTVNKQCASSSAFYRVGNIIYEKLKELLLMSRGAVRSPVASASEEHRGIIPSVILWNQFV